MFDLNQRQEAVYELKRMTKTTPAIAAAFELIGGLFGVLGVGWIYAGDTARGVICLICYMVLWPVAVLIAQFSGGCPTAVCFTSDYWRACRFINFGISLDG